MEHDKPPHNTGSLPPSGRFTNFSPTGTSFTVKPEPQTPPFPPLGGQFSQDVNQMPENPRKNVRHRRAHSEILTLPDDISFDSDLGVVGVDGPSLSDDTEEDLISMYFDMEKYDSGLGSVTSGMGFQVGEGSNVGGLRVRHQHSQSMDGSSSLNADLLLAGSEETASRDSKKAVSAAKLAELAMVDPKRAKRIWANRQSAARSKERKMRYIAELERKVQTLQSESTTLSAQLTMLQRDLGGLNVENSELKLRLQTMEQQVNLQDALNDALKEEIQHLRVLTGQAAPNGGPGMIYPSFGRSQQYYSTNNAMHTVLAAQQFQQLQIHSQKQQHQIAQQEQQVNEMNRRGSVPSLSQKDNVSDSNSSASME